MTMIALTAVVVLAAAIPPDPMAALTRVQEAYRKGGDFSASFTHVQVDKLRGKKKTESGKLWAAKDGRVRWMYDKPVRRDFVFDGKAAFFYEPDNAQVTIFDRFQDSPLWNALRFLWGQGQITQSFDVRACDDGCPAGEPGDVSVKLVPKEPLAAVDHVALFVDPGESRLRKSVVYDSLGNRTEFTFSEVKLGVKVDPKKFDFKIPEGVSILRAGDAAR
jgi:outer membrane lipoprotein carrier protein